MRTCVWVHVIVRARVRTRLRVRVRVRLCRHMRERLHVPVYAGACEAAHVSV